jgi:hypothetical protein
MESTTSSDRGIWFAWRESADFRERFFCWTEIEARQRALEWLKSGEKVGIGLIGREDTPEVIYQL